MCVCGDCLRHAAASRQSRRQKARVAFGVGGNEELHHRWHKKCVRNDICDSFQLPQLLMAIPYAHRFFPHIVFFFLSQYGSLFCVALSDWRTNLIEFISMPHFYSTTFLLPMSFAVSERFSHMSPWQVTYVPIYLYAIIRVLSHIHRITTSAAKNVEFTHRNEREYERASHRCCLQRPFNRIAPSTIFDYRPRNHQPRVGNQLKMNWILTWAISISFYRQSRGIVDRQGIHKYTL